MFGEVKLIVDKNLENPIIGTSESITELPRDKPLG